jgi:phosphoribosylaminoimidazolecarboxamide formyltransferase/IMP cyclohydrolase
MNTFKILNGKELSYNNLKDVDIAWKAVCEFDKSQPACCALKHNTPCGFAIGKDDYDAYIKAYRVDPTSIFGGIVSFNQTVSLRTAQEMSKIFLEVIAAPSYDKKALELLKQKKNLRIIKFTKQPQNKFAVVSIDGGLLVQSEDDKLYEQLKVVTKKQPTKQQMEDLLFAMKVVKYVKSNAIVVANKGVALGIGGGQVNRIWPTIDALKRGKGATVLASDAFFPFNDIVKEAAKYNIKAIIQPGGSLRDTDSIDECNRQNIAMVFSGIRHFKH